MRAHFGEEVAWYLAFMNRYNATLLPFAATGCAVYVLCGYLLPGTYSENYLLLSPLYALLMVVFSALLDNLWARLNHRLRSGFPHAHARLSARHTPSPLAQAIPPRQAPSLQVQLGHL